MTSNNKNSLGITNTKSAQSSMASSTNSYGSLTQSSYKDGFDGDIQKAKQYNQQMSSTGQNSVTSSASSTSSLTQSSYKNGFDGDIQKAKQYNQQMNSTGQSSVTSSVSKFK